MSEPLGKLLRHFVPSASTTVNVLDLETKHESHHFALPDPPGISRRDLLHLLENTFDRKRIYANPSFYPNPNSKPNTNPNPKAQ